MCFQNDGKTAHDAKCIKFRIMTKVIYSVLSIDTFEQQCVVIKGMLKSPLLKDHAKTIDIDQSLINNALFEQKCIQNIKKLYKHAVKCDYQQKFKDILEADMVSTNEGFTNKSPISTMKLTPVNKPSARKSLCIFTDILDVTKKNDIRQVGADKSNRKTSKPGTTPWTLKPKRKGNSKINNQINKSLYNCIMHHPQVVQSPTFQ